MGCPGNLTPWTPAEDAELKKLQMDGFGPSQIARQMKRGESSVRSRIAHFEAVKAKRNCMCCRRLFVSEGPHNRLCATCRNKSHSPYAP